MSTVTPNLGLVLDFYGKVEFEQDYIANMAKIGANLGIVIPVSSQGVLAFKQSFEQAAKQIGARLGTTFVVDTSGWSTFRDSVASVLALIDQLAVPTSIYSIAVSPGSLTESNSGSTVITVTATRRGSLTTAGSVAWTRTGTVDATDFLPGTPSSGVFTFAPGDTTATITQSVQGDTTFEPDETVIYSLSNPTAGAGIGVAIFGAIGTTVVLNDDAAPTSTYNIGATPVSQPEGNSGSVTITVTATRSGDVSGAGTVAWARTGTLDASDFVGGTATSGLFTFAAGATTATITQQVAGDTAAEPDETATYTLSSPTAPAGIVAALGVASTTTVTIVNDDAPAANGAQLDFSDPAQSGDAALVFGDGTA